MKTKLAKRSLILLGFAMAAAIGDGLVEHIATERTTKLNEPGDEGSL